MWVGDVCEGKPHGRGDLILPNGSVHRGGFVDGRASGPGVLYDATGAVLRCQSAWPSSSACTKARAKARPMGTVGLAR